MAKKYQTALVVGRFQPFHKGHLYLLQTALSLAEEVMIAIGSSNSTDADSNPLSFDTRLEMIQTVIEQEGWQSRVKKIVPSPDFPSDEEWRDTLLANAGDFDVAVGNNDWTNGVLAEAGYEIQTIPLLKREEFQGVFIRKLIRNGEAWEERVPPYLVQRIQSLF